MKEEMTTAKHSHYFHDVSHLQQVDIYRMLQLLDIAHPALQHAFKKVAAAGKRGAKSAAQDVQEAIDSLVRWQAMAAEDAGAGKGDCMGCGAGACGGGQGVMRP